MHHLDDPTAEARKKDHIDLALKSQVEAASLDARFYYEPLMAAHPAEGSWPAFDFLGKRMKTPIWVSSMTGGTEKAATINRNLARACAEFGMGMGLGSCRQLLFDDAHLPDFDVREIIGPELPLYANLGIAQLENLIERRETARIEHLLGKLQANGLIIHVNPLQEAMQPEGDIFRRPPIDTIEYFVSQGRYPVIVKEVGQGFGPASLRALLQMPLAGIEFAAGGGTNFALLELLRGSQAKMETFKKVTEVGHTATEMLGFVQQLTRDLGSRVRVRHLIISGGIQHFLDGYYLIKSSPIPAVYGQASAFLKHAQDDYDTLRTYVQMQIRGLELANAFLQVR